MTAHQDLEVRPHESRAGRVLAKLKLVRILEKCRGRKLERLCVMTAVLSNASVANHALSTSPTLTPASSCHPRLPLASVTSHTPAVPIRAPTSSRSKVRYPRPTSAPAKSQTVSSGPLPGPRPMSPASASSVRHTPELNRSGPDCLPQQLPQTSNNPPVSGTMPPLTSKAPRLTPGGRTMPIDDHFIHTRPKTQGTSPSSCVQVSSSWPSASFSFTTQRKMKVAF